MIESSDDIEDLRKELRSTLEQLDEFENTGLVNLPDDPEQLDSIERNLEEALVHIRKKRKANS